MEKGEEEMQQMSIFDDVIPRFMIDRKLRLITLFSGIGCQEQGLKAFNIPFESYKTCEWAANSIIGFNAIHNHIFKNKNLLDKEFLANELYKLGLSLDSNKPATLSQIKRIEINKLNYIYESIKETHNLVNICNVKGKDLEIVDKDKFCYCLTYSFPCQDLSNAGLKKGITEDSRSGMLFQVERILDECKELGCLPDILIMENVPDLVNKKFIKDFQRWRAKLEEIGYSNFDEILNGKDYGIPQNRKREFMVSILGEYNYTFPKKIKLRHHLGDFLMDDSKVDKKYYLSEKMLNGMKHTKFNSYKLENRLQEREREREPNLCIRRLTPCECLTLMGFTTEDYENLVKAGLSDSAIYKCAGDGLISTIFGSIVNNMYSKLNSHEEIINNYVEKEIL